MENLGKRAGTIDMSITNRIQETVEKTLGVEDRRAIVKKCKI